MKRISKILFLIGAALLLLAPMLTTNIKPDQVSEIDNRKLREFPTLQKSGFQSKLEGYVSDRIGFRSEMITAYQKFCDAAFHKLIHPSYIYGKGDYIMVPWDLMTYQHLDVHEEYIESYTDYLKSLEQFCESQGMEFLFFLCPNKETIYPEYFPDGYNVKDQPNRTDRMLEELGKKEVTYLFPKDIFLSLKEAEQLYNVKYDAGHWNQTGAFYGCQQIIHYFNKHFPQMGELQQKEFEVTYTRKESLPISYFKIDEMVPCYNLIETDAVANEKVFESIVATEPNFYHLYYKNNAAIQNGAPKVLIFGDSYFQDSYRFYLNHCSELMLLHAENMPDAEYYISVFQPDIVIYEVVERGLETDRVKFTATKRYYDLNNLQNNNQETGMPLAEQITLDIDMADIRSQSIGQEFVTFSGVLSGMETGDSSDILALAAILNGRVYYSIFDKSDFTYRFTFQAKDIMPSSDISFFILREMRI